ncbi:MAG: hypothetical protein KatS3mg009_1695 [Acidimicrobiia bacterium]|nr:MAG: hypothetical protein KatS3mg009_1695 [Acidimicrobiia bacterium]
MPSPVIGSTTAAASPAYSTRPSARRDGSYAVGIGHARTGPRGTARGPSAARSAGRRATSGHERLQLAARAPGAQHAEPDVRAPAGQREHPRVPGQQVALEQHPQPRVVDVVEVPARGVPGAEVGGRTRVQRAPHRRPVAVRGDDVARLDDLAGRGADLDAVGVGHDVLHGDAGADLGARVARERDERGVEPEARHHPRVLAVGGQRQRDAPSPRRHEHRLAHGQVAGGVEGVAGEAEPLEQPQRLCGQPVAARLVARERGPVEHQGPQPQARRRDGRRGAGRAGPDDEHVHPAGHTATVAAGRAGRRVARFDGSAPRLPESRAVRSHPSRPSCPSRRRAASAR